MLLLAEPTMYMIMALAEKADIPYEFEAGDEYINELSQKLGNMGYSVRSDNLQY